MGGVVRRLFLAAGARFGLLVHRACFPARGRDRARGQDQRPRIRQPWNLLILGQIAFLLGDAIWYAAYLPEEIAPVAPHISDAFYLSGYPLLALAVVLFIRARQPRYRLTAAIDALLDRHRRRPRALAGRHRRLCPRRGDRASRSASTLLAYPVCDVLVLAAAAYLLLSGRQAKGAFWLLAASLAAVAAGDIVYPFLPEGHATDWLSDTLWMVSYGLFGLTALVPSMKNLTEESDAPTAPESGRRLILIGAAISVLPAFALHPALHAGSPGPGRDRPRRRRGAGRDA